MLVPQLVPCVVALAVVAAGRGPVTLLPYVAQAVLFLAIVTVIPDSVRPREFNGPAKGYRLLLWTVVLATMLLLNVLIGAPRTCMMLAVIASGTVAFVWRALPVSYSIRDASREHETSASRFPALAPRPGRAWWWLIWREMVSPLSLIVFFLTLVNLSLLKSGASQLILVAFLAQVFRMRFRWMRHLPVSSRQLFGLSVLPFLAGGMLGAGVGNFVPNPYWGGSRSMGVGAPDPLNDYDLYVSKSNVPLAYWRYAPSGRVPDIVAPWGERCPPYRVRVLGMVFFNPFSIVAASSDRFDAWQFARATYAVYGAPMRREDYQSQRGHLPRHATQRGGALWLQAGLMLCVFLLVQWLAELPAWRRRPLHPVASFALTFAPVAPVLLSVAVDFTNRSAGSAVVASLAQYYVLQLVHAATTPGVLGRTMLYAAVPLFVFGAYRLAAWQYSQSELLTGTPPR